MPSILVCAPPPLREVLVALLADSPAGCDTSKIDGMLRKRVAMASMAAPLDIDGRGGETASGRHEPLPFQVIIQYVDREELRWLSRGRARFAGGLIRQGGSAEDGADHEDGRDRSSHPLEFRRFDEVLEERLSDRDALASLGAYAVPVVFVGTFELPGTNGEDEPQSVEDLDLLFLDSSIWHRYVQISAVDGLSSLEERIEEARKWYGQGRFCLNVAVEFLDYSVRALRHLYLVRGPDSGNHGDFIALHGFHSETAKAGAADSSRKKVERGLDSVKVRCLLVDDFASESLRCLHNAARLVPDEHGGPSKGAIIRDVLQDQSSGTFELVDCPSYDAARKVLGLDSPPTVEEPFDLLFLDYLLNERTEGQEAVVTRSQRSARARWTGVDLINHLATRSVASPTVAAFGRHWILPVSSFPTIFETELRRGEATNVEQSYYLAPGADPVCTPELFCFRVWDLLRTMREQVDVATLNLADLLPPPVIQGDHDRDTQVEGNLDSRWLMSLYERLSRRREAFERIKSDADLGSHFAKSFRESESGSAARRIEGVLGQLVELLHHVLWGGAVSRVERLDGLDLADYSVQELLKSDAERDSWSRIVRRLRHMILTASG